jgi:drug/metabolite transporter (DMT)-like permease
MPILAVIAAQLLYTISDTWKKVVFNNAGFSVKTLTSPVFAMTLVLALAGFLIQLYALSKLELSKTIVLLGMLAVVFSSLAGVFYLKEHLNAWNWAGVGLALVAIVLVSVK